MNQKIAIGRIVVAVIRSLSGELVERPAIIARTWGENSMATTVAIQAVVFTDSANDGLDAALPKSSLMYDDTGIAENSWHWPVREMPMAAKLESLARPDWVGLHEKALKICQAVEELAACDQATILSVMASELAQAIHAASLGK